MTGNVMPFNPVLTGEFAVEFASRGEYHNRLAARADIWHAAGGELLHELDRAFLDPSGACPHLEMR